MRKIPSTPEKLWADVEGDIESVDGLMRVTAIRVRYRIKIPEGKREAALRAVDSHPSKCPAAVSVRDCIRIEIEADIQEI